MRSFRLFVWTVATMLAIGQSASASVSVDGRILLRGLTPDVVFTLGVAETKEIDLIAFYADLPDCHDEGAGEVTVPGVVIDSPCYGCSGGSSFQAILDAASPPGKDGWDHPFTVTLTYDGSGSVAKHGEFRVYSANDCCDVCTPTYLHVGSVNVHILPAASSKDYAFQVTSPGSSSNYFLINHPVLNGQPYAKPMVTPVGGYGSTYGGNTVGVWYSAGTQKWSIYNENLASMASGQDFNVALGGYASQRAYVHETTAANTAYNYTWLDDDRLNGNWYARPVIGHVYNPVGFSSNYHNHNVGVWYSSTYDKWAIYNEDQSTMQTGITFHVLPAAAPETDTYNRPGELSSISGYFSPDAWVAMWDTSETPSIHNILSPVLYSHSYSYPEQPGSPGYYDHMTTAYSTLNCSNPPWCFVPTAPGKWNAAGTGKFFTLWEAEDGQ